MNDKKTQFFKVILLFSSIIFIFLGSFLFIYKQDLSNIPEYYTDEEIDEYVKAVYGEDCKFIRKDEEHEYIYEDGRGIQFPVSAISDEVFLGISWMGRTVYRKAVFDNYWEAVVEYYQPQIYEIAKNNGMDVAYFEYVIVLKAKSKKQIEKAATVIEEIDHLLNLNADYDNGKLHRYEITVIDYRLKISLAIYGLIDNSWIFNEKIRVCEFDVSMDENNRLTKEKVLNEID